MTGERVRSLGDYVNEHPEIREILDGPTSHASIAATLPYDEASVRRWRKRNDWQKPPAPEPEPDSGPAPIFTDEDAVEPDLQGQNDELRAANQRLYKSLVKSRQRSEEMIQAVYDAARDAATSTPPVKTVKAPTRDRRVKQEEAALWHLTDWQQGKVTSTFDSGVCEKRIINFVNKAKQITEVMRADHPVKHGIVLMTGDMLEGCNIFPGQAYETEAPLFEQIFRTAALEEWVIGQALNTYETVDVICEWGNHGRIGKKSDGFKPSDNVDRIIYEIVRGRFSNENRIRNFQVSDAWYQHFTYGNYSAIAIHGDEIKSFGGNTPSYGILRKANAWASGVVEPFMDLYLGHYHQWMDLSMANGGTVYMSGSTESDNEYAREFVAAVNSPSQRVNMIDPEKGIVTYESRIWVG
jgi:hypothetical protein